MADFIQSLPFFDIESLNQFSGLNMESTLAFNYQTLLPINSSIHDHDSLQNHHLPPPGFSVHNNHHQSCLVSSSVNSQPIFTPKTEEETPEISRKRKTLGASQTTSFKSSSSSSSSLSSSPQVSDQTGGMIKRKINKSGRGKRAKIDDHKEVEKPKDVVHVRARRGQATDSHSLAERVRRGKINERLKCLQDIVPGCYKTMGMAVMLDEIINYVQSLQNQVEFLSMKLTAASTYYDFNSESNAMETMQAQEAKELERLMREGGYVGVGGLACFHSSSSSTWSSLT